MIHFGGFFLINNVFLNSNIFVDLHVKCALQLSALSYPVLVYNVMFHFMFSYSYFIKLTYFSAFISTG